MVEAARTTPKRNWRTVAFASDPAERRNWKQEQLDAENDMDSDVDDIDQKAIAAQADATQALADATSAATAAAQAQTDAANALAQVGGAYLKASDSASDIRTGSESFSIKDVLDDYLGHGWVDGHDTFQDNGDGTVTINGGYGYLRSSQDTTGPINKYSVAGATLELVDNSTNWIYQSYNGGSPVLGVSNVPTSIRGRQDINIIKVVDREGLDIKPVNSENGWKAFHSIVSQKFFDEATGQGYRSAQRVSGAEIATVGTRHLFLNAGIFWGGAFRTLTQEIDTSAGDTATQWYGNTAVGFTPSTITQTNNTQYFNGTALANLTTNQYAIRWEWMLSSGDELHQMIGTGQYVSEEAARVAADTKPTDIPPRLARFGTFVGRKIVKQGTDTIIDLPVWTSPLAAGGNVTHDSTLEKDSSSLYQHIPLALKNWLTGVYNGTPGTRDANGFVTIKDAGSFVIPSGATAGSYDITVDGVLNNVAGPPYEAMNYKAFIGIQKAGTPGGFNSEHAGILLYGDSDLTQNVDTIHPSAEVDCVTGVVAIDSSTDGQIAFRVSWDTTNRPSALTLHYSILIDGHVKTVGNAYV